MSFFYSRFYVYTKYFKLSKEIKGHLKGVNSVRFSPDCTKIVSSSNDGTVRIWDVESGKEVQTLKGHSGPVIGAQFSTHNDMIMSFSEDNTIRLWNKTWKTEKILVGHSKTVTNAQFSWDNQMIVSMSLDETIRIWDVNSGNEIKRRSEVNNARFSSNGLSIAAITKHTIVIWNIQFGERKKILGKYLWDVSRSQLSPDGKSIAIDSSDELRIWDIVSNKEKKVLICQSKIRDFKFSSDSQTIVSCSDDKIIRIWNVKFGIEIQALQRNLNGVTSVDIAPNGNFIVSSSDDGTICLWEQL
ncbi:WD repeat-containing protein [Reticulomyxa filosa]|uniref:WD repeat-containing protein n=1 Tax=Reticulomyxa filosa TaxID=46433 RepID=X6NFV9_RETFI|nr:WD repeat-containing protein [Reticulomyxa filosa]|eukprot:ETO24227.1 WD repeat-containing protein [Reticulomyxa filosa]